MGQETLLVCCDEGAVEVVGESLASRTDAAVGTLTTVDRLLRELSFEQVDCLLVDEVVDGREGAEVARGVRCLFPGLPIVVVGLDAEAATDLDVTGAGSALTDDAVVDAVRTSLDTGAPSAASRAPSRLETLLASMFEEFPDHMFAKDDAARHVLTNNEAIPLSEAIGLTDFDVESGPDEDHARKTVNDDHRVLEEGEPLVGIEEYIEADDGHTQTSKVPWYGPDREILGLVGISRDISARKNREQALRQRNERLAKVALVAAHELRNELQVATGRLDLLASDDDQVEVVAESLDRLATIVDDVVALATQERRVLDDREVWISTPAYEVWESLDTGSADLFVADDRRILADLEALRLLFDVLLSNALDHGGDDVRVTLGSTDDGFYVADDGPGIRVDPPDRVFDAGFAGRDENPGFGLYVAQRIVNDHGWSLDASNRPDGGARFDVRDVATPDDSAGTDDDSGEAEPDDSGEADSDDPTGTSPDG